MLHQDEREAALTAMQVAANAFYCAAIKINVHPFIEFAGLMNEYIKVCRQAHAAGIDFSDCSRHTGRSLPLHAHQIDYINEKLDCIYTGNVVFAQTGYEPMM